MLLVLSLVLILKQQFIELINGKNQTKRTDYFHNIINIEEFNSSLLKIDKNCTKILIFTILDTSQFKKLMIV